MKKDKVPFAKCPYCPKKCGQLYFDSRAATEEQLDYYGTADPNAVYAADFLCFETEASAPGPCEHCAYLALDIAVTRHKFDESDDPFSDGYEMCWRNPEFKKLMTNDCSWTLLMQIVNSKAYVELRERSRLVGLEKELFGEHPAWQEGEGGQRVTLLGIEVPPRTEERDRCLLENCQPETKIHDCPFSKQWTDSDQREFSAKGWVLFAEDIERLTHELNAQVDRVCADYLAM